MGTIWTAANNVYNSRKGIHPGKISTSLEDLAEVVRLMAARLEDLEEEVRQLKME